MEGHFRIVSTIPVHKEGIHGLNWEGWGDRGIVINLDKGLGDSYQEMAVSAGIKPELGTQNSLFKSF